eukprot:TRINITY_DN11951_c0_g1_i5.p3 TRINITY_DN11951_c0_g1~~TRINITY_DN11951_c0_g1_i5.p3  ORF type:complete len:177 (+),score=34.61 TRINITY_DN11951_c0_g1_i5:1004-1534(+)
MCLQKKLFQLYSINMIQLSGENRMKKTEMLKKHRSDRDSAVSPVVGVMLMLVVTIIVAALVAAFAGGIGTTTEAAPTASLDVSLFIGQGSAMIENIAGDTLPTKDLLITVSYGVPVKFANKALDHGGETIIHTIDGRLEPTAENDPVSYTHLTLPTILLVQISVVAVSFNKKNKVQ